MSQKADKLTIPSWQRAQSTTPASPPTSNTEEPAQQRQAEATPEPGAEEFAEHRPAAGGVSLSEQASKFLKDPSIRDAPQDRKAAFLEMKGLSKDEVEKLLGAELEQDTSSKLLKEGEEAWSKTSPSNSKPQSCDFPPIVTYPEFLTQTSKPPPLITARHILNTAYITGGLASTIYGFSKYIIAPMAGTLAEARHDFASHTQTQINHLNSRLSSIVSTDPPTALKQTTMTSKPADPADDVSEADSDPTELYNRDYGTQTSPHLSHRPSTASSTTDSSDPEASSTVAGHESQLKILTSHLRELEAASSNDSVSTDSFRTQLQDLTTYLNEMIYQNQCYGPMGMYGVPNYGVPKTKDGKDDQIEALKAEIRGVKGVLLSARNFPAGGRTVGRVGA